MDSEPANLHGPSAFRLALDALGVDPFHPDGTLKDKGAHFAEVLEAVARLPLEVRPIFAAVLYGQGHAAPIPFTGGRNSQGGPFLHRIAEAIAENRPARVMWRQGRWRVAVSIIEWGDGPFGGRCVFVDDTGRVTASVPWCDTCEAVYLKIRPHIEGANGL